MINMHSSILLQIKYVKDKQKLKDLHYLVNEHKEIVEDYDISFLNKEKDERTMFSPWIIVKNNGEGLFLAKKIIEKFEPWVSMFTLTNVQKKDIPEEILRLYRWTKKNQENLANMKIDLK